MRPAGRRSREMAEHGPGTASGGAGRRGNFLKEIHGKSDRAVAIVGAALLNAHLEQLLTAFFVDDPELVSALLGSDRPVGTFAARIRLAYLCGLISRDEHQDLNAINQVDEAFIREMGELSFGHLPVRGWCLDLSLPNKVMLSGEDRTPRRMFVFSVALLLRQLALRTEAAEQARRTPPTPFTLLTGAEGPPP